MMKNVVLSISIILSLLVSHSLYASSFKDKYLDKNYKSSYNDDWESDSIADDPLPLRKPNTLSLNTRVIIPSSVGVFITYDYSFVSWLSAGFGFGYTSGGTPKFNDIPFYQLIFPVYLNVYPISSPNFHHRWLWSFNVEPLIEYDQMSGCEIFDDACNPILKKRYVSTNLGGGTGYEYRSEEGITVRLLALVLTPVPNPTIPYLYPKNNPGTIHYSVLPAVQFTLGYSL